MRSDLHLDALADGSVSAEITAELIEAMAEFGIDTPTAQAMFLAQIAHESDGLRWVKERWGPTPAQVRYEGRLDLGNVYAGDGKRFCGRGYLQITGRANYVEAAKALGIDCVEHPEILESPSLAARSAAWWWQAHGCNALCVPGDEAAFERVTRRINGGLNGLEDRQRRWKLAKAAIAQWSVEEASAPIPADPDQPTQEDAMPVPLIPLAAALLPMVADLFKRRGTPTASRNSELLEQYGPTLVEVAKKVTGEATPEAAVAAAITRPDVQAAIRHEFSGWLVLTEAGSGGIAGAREFAAASSSHPFWMMPVFWITLALLPLVYGTVWAVLTGGTEAFSGELKAAIAMAVVSGVLGALTGFWLGSSFGSQKKDEALGQARA